MFKRSKSEASVVLKNNRSSAKRLLGGNSQRRASFAGKVREKLGVAPKGIMKFVSADESIHSTYGKGDSSNRSGNNKPENATSDSDESGSRGVKFHQIQIREYARTVGDNPSCSSGPPIGISWEYNPSTKILTIEEYENVRPQRRTHFEMVLPRKVRDQMLRHWDVSRGEIANAVRQSIKIKTQRRTTVNNLSKSKAEETMEKTGRKLMRGLLLRPSTGKQVAELERQYEMAEQQRKQMLLEAEMADEQATSNGSMGNSSGVVNVIVATEEDEEDYNPASQDEEEYDPTELEEYPEDEEPQPPLVKDTTKEQGDERSSDGDHTPVTIATTEDEDEKATSSNDGSDCQSKGEDTAQVQQQIVEPEQPPKTVPIEHFVHEELEC